MTVGVYIYAPHKSPQRGTNRYKGLTIDESSKGGKSHGLEVTISDRRAGAAPLANAVVHGTLGKVQRFARRFIKLSMALEISRRNGRT